MIPVRGGERFHLSSLQILFCEPSPAATPQFFGYGHGADFATFLSESSQSSARPACFSINFI